MIDITDKKYELIDIGGDGKSSCLEDFHSDLLIFSGYKNEFSEEFRIEANISEIDFYSKEIEVIKTIDKETSEKISYMTNYTYNNHEWVRELLSNKVDDITRSFLSCEQYTGYNENCIIKFKPAKCLYKYCIIEEHIEYIYEIIASGAETTVWIGEY